MSLCEVSCVYLSLLYMNIHHLASLAIVVLVSSWSLISIYIKIISKNGLFCNFLICYLLCPSIACFGCVNTCVDDEMFVQWLLMLLSMNIILCITNNTYTQSLAYNYRSCSLVMGHLVFREMENMTVIMICKMS
jgi:hypothetical protein